METWDAIRALRNVRNYEDRAIAPADLDRILEAGRRAPSSKNEQPWEFVVVTDPSALTRLSNVWQHAGHVARAAAAIGLIAPVTDDQGEAESINYDHGQVTMSMMLAAADLGIGSAHAWVQDKLLAGEILQIPNDREVSWVIAFGYPADRPLAPIEEPDRRPFDDVVRRDRW